MKKHEKNNKGIKNDRKSYLMIGLVCATSLTLMSFEYATFRKTNIEIAAKKSLDEPKDIWAYAPPKIEIPVASPVIKESKDVVVIAPEPIITPPIIPLPTPNPIISPLPPLPGPPMPEPVVILPKEPYIIVEQMPEFPGGTPELYKYLGNKVKYPQISKDRAVEGKVFVQFVVEEDGSISNIEIIKGVDKYIDAEAASVVKSMPNWTPGKQRNQTVRVKFVLPMDFKMQH